jgi:hypothetical protein
VIHSEFHSPSAAAAGATFPSSCGNPPAAMTPQEKALEFMLLGLTDCVSPQGPVAPAPLVQRAYPAATFVETFSMPICTAAGQANCCPTGTHVVWRELDWQASIPSTASIGFALQTADPSLDGGPPDWTSAMPIPLPTATSSTRLPLFDVALIDTGTTGAFNQAMPPILSKTELRLTVTLSPTADGTQAPTLLAWLIKADCMPSE